ncbi:MAG: histidine--tRNA ligase [Caldilinea sp.]|nr:histidine--tRNA ligase [Caldilineaceae bacterium]MCB9121865.1 histidine--tRNA ligase [Caldilineaceae bacterium]MCB9124421.1 histidine--tRNA ligase [Caldilineaceae bacterium]MCO5210193.1 histidine--tRNA ligase [Caldilinea sp.]MCW5840600.1 histidine--tRNA ligase [Caldilinea sp.]
MAKINTEPLSGMRDFLPLDVLRRDYVTETVKRVYQRYGFEPLETPTMERLTTLLGKYGDEGDQLIFRVLKRGEKLERALADAPTENSVSDAGMRYDLTVPLARVFAEYRSKLPRFFKRYQMQPVYRADRPAKGRYREFFQCDVDVVGSTSPTVEAEVIAAGAEVLQELGFQGRAGFAIRLNHRMILRGLMEVAGVPHDLEGAALVAIDKLDKIGLEGVRKELDARGVPAAAAESLLGAMAAAPAENSETIAWLSNLLEISELGSRGVAELKQVMALSAGGPAAEHLRIDPYLARGLSYYTGPIFEIEFPGLSGSGGGGGRYDDLIGMFSGQTIPACGFSLGLERIILIMEERGMFPERLSTQPQVLVTMFDDSTVAASLALARRLRAAGLRVDVYPDNDRYGKQFKYAEERSIRYAALLSPREQEAGVVAVKDLVTGEQVEIADDAVVEWLLAAL